MVIRELTTRSSPPRPKSLAIAPSRFVPPPSFRPSSVVLLCHPWIFLSVLLSSVKSVVLFFLFLHLRSCSVIRGFSFPSFFHP